MNKNTVLPKPKKYYEVFFFSFITIFLLIFAFTLSVNNNFRQDILVGFKSIYNGDLDNSQTEKFSNNNLLQYPVSTRNGILLNSDNNNLIEDEIQSSIDKTNENQLNLLPDIPLAYCVPSIYFQYVGEVNSINDDNSIVVLINNIEINIDFIGVQFPELKLYDNTESLINLQNLIGKNVTVSAEMEISEKNNFVKAYVFEKDKFLNYQFIENGKAINNSVIHPCSGFFIIAEEETKLNKGSGWLSVDLRTDPNVWETSPIIPTISENAKNIYLKGLDEGSDSHSFSVIGDCQSLPNKLFGRFDWDSYQLDSTYAYLNNTINYFSGDFNRWSTTIADGATVATMFSVFWADPNACHPSENPLECEFRLNNPSVVLVSLGTNWKTNNISDFNKYLRKIVDFSIANNALPILATKVDETKMNLPLNQVIAQVAYDYDIPLWNFWAAAQSLPNNGLDASDPYAIHFLDAAYPLKRITGLQALKAVLDASVAP